MAVWVLPDEVRDFWRATRINRLVASEGPSDLPPETKLENAIDDAQTIITGKLKMSAYANEIGDFTDTTCPRQLKRFIFNLVWVALYRLNYDNIPPSVENIRRETFAELLDMQSGGLAMEIDSAADEADEYVLVSSRDDDADPAITLKAMADW